MKFRVRETEDNFDTWVVADGDTRRNTRKYISRGGTVTGYYSEYGTEYGTKAEAQAALDLYREKQKLPQEPVAVGEVEIRTFDTGATRDTIQGKLDYMKALSPIVLRRYVQYLDKHRLQPDGSVRDFDNWKKGIPQGTYHSSKGRHFFATWLLVEGYGVEDNHGPVNEEDALCGEIFNAMGKLHEIVKERLAKEDRTKTVKGGY